MVRTDRLGAAEDVGRRVADDDDLLAGVAVAGEPAGALDGDRRQLGPQGRIGAAGRDLEERQQAGRRELEREAAGDVAGQHAEHDAAVDGQGGDQLAHAGQHLDLVVAHLIAQDLDVALEARLQALAQRAPRACPSASPDRR